MNDKIKYHNPENLDPNDDQKKYRLLSVDEVKERQQICESSELIECKYPNDIWKKNCIGNSTDITYRTMNPEGYFLPKEKSDKEKCFEIFDKLPKNIADLCKKRYDEGYNFHEGVNSFDWEKTPEGYSFWHLIFCAGNGRITIKQARKEISFLFFEKMPEHICKLAKVNFDVDHSEWIPDNITDAIFTGFDWEKTEQGDDFWCECSEGNYPQVKSPAQKSLEHWQEIKFPEDFGEFSYYFGKSCQSDKCALCKEYSCKECPLRKEDNPCNVEGSVWNKIRMSKSVEEANMHKAEMVALLSKIVFKESK